VEFSAEFAAIAVQEQEVVFADNYQVLIASVTNAAFFCQSYAPPLERCAGGGHLRGCPPWFRLNSFRGSIRNLPQIYATRNRVQCQCVMPLQLADLSVAKMAVDLSDGVSDETQSSLAILATGDKSLSVNTFPVHIDAGPSRGAAVIHPSGFRSADS
jgi:hypothetical protein